MKVVIYMDDGSRVEQPVDSIDAALRRVQLIIETGWVGVHQDDAGTPVLRFWPPSKISNVDLYDFSDEDAAQIASLFRR